jgi:hypothetical protein
VAIRKLSRDPEQLDVLHLYAKLDPIQAAGSSLRDPARVEEFVKRIRTSIVESIQTPSRMHGLRAQALFRATLVALAKFKLLVDEDVGDAYFDDSAGSLSPPDFRVVDGQGNTLLVEVKSIKLTDPLKPFRLRRSDVEAWRRWGELTGAPVALALWWVVPGMWTLVSLDRLRPAGSKLEIDLVDAIAANEMSRFGDCLLGTKPPLIFRLRVHPEGVVDESTGTVPVRIDKAELVSGGRTIEDELERSIAWYFLNFGRWEVEQELRFDTNGDPVAIDMVAQPEVVDAEQQAEQDFATVGMLSSLYAALFNERTLSDDGEVDQLDHEPEPGELADLIPDDFWDRTDRVLPVWRMNIQPTDPDAVVRRRSG